MYSTNVIHNMYLLKFVKLWHQFFFLVLLYFSKERSISSRFKMIADENESRLMGLDEELQKEKEESRKNLSLVKEEVHVLFLTCV